MNEARFLEMNISMQMNLTLRLLLRDIRRVTVSTVTICHALFFNVILFISNSKSNETKLQTQIRILCKHVLFYFNLLVTFLNHDTQDTINWVLETVFRHHAQPRKNYRHYTKLKLIEGQQFLPGMPSCHECYHQYHQTSSENGRNKIDLAF